MPESIDAFDELQQIRLRLDAIEQTQEMLVRANSAEVLAEVDRLVERDEMAARIYLLVNGVRTQQDIAAELSTSEATVSRRLERLRDLHLIRLLDKRGGGNIYQKSAAERILRLSPRIQRSLERSE